MSARDASGAAPTLNLANVFAAGADGTLGAPASERFAGDDFVLGDGRERLPREIFEVFAFANTDRKNGRPSEMTPARVAGILDSILTGATFEQAAAENGISERTFHRWRDRGERSKTLDEFRQFWQLIQWAKVKARRIPERTFYRAAAHDWKAARDLLTRRHPEDWRVRFEIDDKTPEENVPARERLLERLEGIERRLAGAGAAAIPLSPAGLAEREEREEGDNE